MPLYRYVGVDRKNKNVQGEIWAEDKQELQEELQVFGIFLVSWNIVADRPLKSPPAPAPEEASETDDNEPRGMGETGPRKKAKWLPKKPIHYVFLVVAISLGIGLGQWVYSPKPVHEYLEAPPEIRTRLSGIHPGVTRAEVEKLLNHRDKGDQFDMITRYFVPPTTWIWVSYDRTGGSWDPSNQVISWPNVSNSKSPSGALKK